MKILVTGTNGFIGKNLKESLINFTDDLYTPKRQELNLLDSDSVQEYLTKHSFDVVIHCGVNIHSVEENLKMYFNIERCSSSFGRLLVVGSGAEYDMRNYHPAMKEDYFLENIPTDVYGFSKYVIAKDIEINPRNIFNLRVFGIFGKYEDHTRRFISNNICRVLSGSDISMNKNMLFDYLYVDDFTRIIKIFFDNSPMHRSYNICAEKSIDLLSIAKIIQMVDGNKVSISVKEEGLNPEYSGNNSLFINEFGNFDYTPLHQAIEELYAWYSDKNNILLDPKDFL
jgi:UDP-glucose 4-epimerase